MLSKVHKNSQRGRIREKIEAYFSFRKLHTSVFFKNIPDTILEWINKLMICEHLEYLLQATKYKSCQTHVTSHFLTVTSLVRGMLKS